MIAAAIRGALSDRARDGRVHVVSELVPGDVPSTKKALAALAAVSTTEKVLVVLRRDDEISWVSLRNAVDVDVIAVDQLNAYDNPRRRRGRLHAVLARHLRRRPGLGSFGQGVGPVREVVGTDELAAASVEDSAEPSDADLAASAASVAEALEPTADVSVPAGSSTYGPGSYVGEEPPAGFDIKGNEDSMKFHTPASPYYGRTIAEVWFDSVDAAQAAGFTDAVRATEEDAK